VTAAPPELISTPGLSMAERAYAVIRDRLVMLEIRPNDPIDDGGLAQELGMGRTPVREARKPLEGDRLVVADPPGGGPSLLVSTSLICPRFPRSLPSSSRWLHGAPQSAHPA
jgi:Bacterial regulatory proteins, gntR family